MTGGLVTRRQRRLTLVLNSGKCENSTNRSSPPKWRHFLFYAWNWCLKGHKSRSDILLLSERWWYLRFIGVGGHGGQPGPSYGRKRWVSREEYLCVEANISGNASSWVGNPFGTRKYDLEQSVCACVYVSCVCEENGRKRCIILSLTVLAVGTTPQTSHHLTSPISTGHAHSHTRALPQLQQHK